MPLTQPLGPRLNALLTVRDAAGHLGVAHSMIVRYEHGEKIVYLTNSQR